MGLEFKKKNKILGIECGYYFKNIFLSRYKTEAIKIIRDRIEEAGSKVGDRSRSNWEKGQELLPDEAKLIHEEWEKGNLKTKKTHEKKKEFYKEIHKRVLKRMIITLQEKIRMREMRRKELLENFDATTKTIQDTIQEIEKALI